MGSRTFKAPSHQTDSIMMVKKKCQSDGRLVCISEEEAGAISKPIISETQAAMLILQG